MDHHSIINTSYAGLITLAGWMERKGIWQTVADHVIIRQKTVKHRPIDKLLDVFIHILTGEPRLVTMNTGIRCDAGVQRAFGRVTCVEQSLASTTLNRCDQETVRQMQQVVAVLTQKHSRCFHHPYPRQWQVLDVDMTGLLAGEQAEGSEKGYFANKRGARGRQLGRVLAANYGEVVYEQLYRGRAHLESKLQELIEGAAEVLALDQPRRQRTLLRIDGAAGSDRFLNWALAAGYGILTKVHNWKRAGKLAASVQQWHPDPREQGREVGWVTRPHPYCQPTRQLAIRKKNRKQKWQYTVLVTTLPPNSLRWLARQPTPRPLPSTNPTMWAFLYAYDRRGGGVETSIRESKQALGLSKRNKRRFTAQQMLVLLTQLAHNLLVWFRHALAVIDAQWKRIGLLRFVRDFLHMRANLQADRHGHIRHITLTPATSHTVRWLRACRRLRPPDDLSLSLYEK